MVRQKISFLIVLLGGWTVCCISGGCLETAETVPNEESDYDYYDNQQQTDNIISISVACSSVNLNEGPLSSDEQKNYQCSQCPQKLTVTNSVIPTILRFSFNNYLATTILDMRSNQVENILPGAFDSLTSLQVLYLSNNSIINISEGTFNSLVNLTMLDLSKNNIKYLSSFHGCISLDFLNLSVNDLEHFDINSLVNQRGLIQLDLSSNKLEIFNFTTVYEIRKMKLSNNRISNIYGCFAQVLVLDISKNSLSTLSNITCNESNPKIMFLDVSHNALSNLETTPALENIKYLSLQNNHIKFIPNDYFSKSNKLTFLNLSTNELEKLQYGLFDGLTELNELHLSKNHLTSFKNHNYHLLKNLHKLFLHDNEINIFDSKDIKETLKQLQELSLDGNNFTCDKLIEIFHDLKDINIFPGNSFHSSNIHGIACSETDYNLEETTKRYDDSDETFRSKLLKMLKIDFTNSSLYNYFNKDFAKSGFNKYLENLQLDESIYIKDLQKNSSATSLQEVQNYSNNSFRNSYFVKYFEQFKGTKNNSQF